MVMVMTSKKQLQRAEDTRIVITSSGVRKHHFKAYWNSPSGRTYENNLSYDMETGEMVCDCRWCSLHREKRECSNILALRKWIRRFGL